MDAKKSLFGQAAGELCGSSIGRLRDGTARLVRGRREQRRIAPAVGVEDPADLVVADHRAPVEPEPDAETNFQEAKADYEAGMLSGRDIRWFLAERAKRGLR